MTVNAYIDAVHKKITDACLGIVNTEELVHPNLCDLCLDCQTYTCEITIMDFPCEITIIEND